MSGRYRVAQWAHRSHGMSSLRSAIEHPQLDLVGVSVNSDTKVGQDAGVGHLHNLTSRR
jgi:hypothetical protein